MFRYGVSLLFLGMLAITACESKKAGSAGNGAGEDSPGAANNQAPVVSIGSDQQVTEKTNIILSSASFDSDGEIVRYEWSQVDGPFAVELTNPLSPSSAFISPPVDRPTTITFRIEVEDNNGAEAHDETTITIVPQNTPPQVVASPDQEVVEFQEVRLFGIVEDDQSVTTYRWTQVSGTQVALLDLGDGTATFYAPSLQASETLVFDLLVIDGDGDSANATTKVTVVPKPLRAITGSIEKGPFGLSGSVVFGQYFDIGGIAQEIAKPTANIVDNLGGYALSVKDATWYRVAASGTYFSEVGGMQGAAPITLKAHHYISSEFGDRYNVNVLTHIIAGRVQYLVGRNLSPVDAITQAENELKRELKSLLGSGPEEHFFALSLYQSDSSTGSSYLIGLSSLLEHYAQKTSETPVELIYALLEGMQNDMVLDGTLESSKGLLDELYSSMPELDVLAINQSLNTLVEGLDSVQLADINAVIDSDLDGKVNQQDEDSDNDQILNEDDPSPYTPSFLVENRAVNVQEDAELQIDVLTNKPLADGEIAIVITRDASNGSLTVDYPMVSYRPGRNYVGDDVFSYQLTQGDIVSDPVNVSLGVIAVNDPPSISGNPDLSATAGVEYSFVPQAQDVEDEALYFSVENLPPWANFDENTGALSGTPSNEDKGVYEGILVSVRDSESAVSLDPFSLIVNTNPFSNLAPAPKRLSNAKAQRIGDKVYWLGGISHGAAIENEDSGQPNLDVLVYDLTENVWDTIGQLPVNATALEVNAINGVLYVLAQESSIVFAQQLTDSMYAFEPSTNQWTELASMPVLRSSSTSQVVGDRIYIMGGFRREGEQAVEVDEVHIYDSVNDTWSEGAPMPGAVYGACSVVIDTDIYVISGNAGNQISNYIYVYDTQSGSWSEIEMPRELGRANGGCNELNGYIYLLGGSPYSASFTTYGFNVREARWYEGDYLPWDQRMDFSIINYQGKAYQFPGKEYRYWANELTQFDPALVNFRLYE